MCGEGESNAIRGLADYCSYHAQMLADESWCLQSWRGPVSAPGYPEPLPRDKLPDPILLVAMDLLAYSLL